MHAGTPLIIFLKKRSKNIWVIPIGKTHDLEQTNDHQTFSTAAKKEDDPFYRSESELLGKSFDGPFYYPYQRKIKSKGRVEHKVFDKKDKEHGSRW